MRNMFVLIALLCLGGMAYADDHIVGKYPACISESLHNQLMTAIRNKDEAAWKVLMDNGCFFPNDGLKVKVISGMSVLQVRATLGNRSLVFWTVMENVAHEK